MNKKLKQAIHDLFEILTPDQKARAFDFMQEMILAQDAKAPVVDDHSGEPKTEVTISEMVKAFDRCSWHNKWLISVQIISDLAATFQTTISLCKAKPEYMDTLPVSTLRDIAGFEHQKASKTMFSSFPVNADILLSLDCLQAFSAETQEPTMNDLKDLKTSLVELWSWESSVEAKEHDVAKEDEPA